MKKFLFLLLFPACTQAPLSPCIPPSEEMQLTSYACDETSNRSRCEWIGPAPEYALAPAVSCATETFECVSVCDL